MEYEKQKLDENEIENKNEDYAVRFGRNIGILSKEEQNKLKNAKIAILGNGGIGAPLAINLAYSGITDFILADFDKIELSNLNRQPYTEADVGKYKVEVLKEKILSINRYAKVEAYKKITEENIASILGGVDIAALSLDGPVGSIIVSRKCRELNIPMIEGWATPYIFARWFTGDSPDYETCYGLETRGKTIEEIANSPQIQSDIKKAFMEFFLTLPRIKDHYMHDAESFEKMMMGKLPLRSFAPIVWAESIYMVHDLIFAGLLCRKEKILAPEVKAFDFIKMCLITQ